MFSEEQRRIFSYKVQDKVLHGDPTRLYRLLWGETDGKLGKLLEESGHDDFQVADAALEKLKAATCAAFGLPPLDLTTGQGLNEDEILSILDEFLTWLEAKKKSRESTPPSAPPSAA